MKKLFLVMSALGWFSLFFSCLDQEDSDFEPKVAAVNNSYYGKGGDSIPPESNDSARDTGGEEEQIPVKP